MVFWRDNPKGSDLDETRALMVEGQLVPRGITHEGVLEAMRSVPRHEFVPENRRSMAYHDGAMPIGLGQTISQPFMVAVMTQCLFPGTVPSRNQRLGEGAGIRLRCCQCWRIG